MYKYLSPMLHLALIAVKVGKDCYPNIKKVLNPEWYLFNREYLYTGNSRKKRKWEKFYFGNYIPNDQ